MFQSVIVYLDIMHLALNKPQILSKGVVEKKVRVIQKILKSVILFQIYKFNLNFLQFINYLQEYAQPLNFPEEKR